MMTIKSMTATFGKLERARLRCAPGLNLIHAPNEGGKSTWCAFYRAMLYGIDTRDRNKKGHLAEKNRYLPWSGSPMEGEMILDWNGREIAIRRTSRPNAPFGVFSAVYTDSGEKVPGMTGENCGTMLTGVSREVFERSAFIGGDAMAVTAAPELEKRISALLTAGQEDISFSQVQSRLKEFLNRRRVNRSVGLIPRLETDLAAARESLERAERCADRANALSAARDALLVEQSELEGELELHRRLAQKALNARYAQSEEDFAAAQSQLERLEREASRFGALPPREELKRVQFDLQYLKVLDEEIKSAQSELEQADEAYIQAQIAAQNDHFTGLSAQQARAAVTTDRLAHQSLTARAARKKKWLVPLVLLAVLCAGGGLAADFYLSGQPFLFTLAGGCAALVLLLTVLVLHLKGKKELAKAAAIPKKYAADDMEQLAALLCAYEESCAHAQSCADHAKTVRGALSDLQARKENSRTDIFAFVHTFAPEVKELFGCSAALSRALNLDHEREAARERLEQRRLRRDDLRSQGGQPFQTLELLHPPARSEEQTRMALAQATSRLAQTQQELSHALGQRQELGDPAALSAAVEELENALKLRTREYEAVTVAMQALEEANEALQQRYSPRLNALAGAYFARLTGDRYTHVTLNRDMEGEVTQSEAVLPRSALTLSRGSTDQLYLAVRLAVYELCLDSRPPVVLDDALTTFDDARLKLALQLLQELAETEQILLFTCQKREGAALEELV